ncbi:MAG: hypothetical protein JWQ87_283 [Candidatus Sulfotelmatobacter sp.]|nr:hypothetical protein [Candidatus Sulfotelmatobacter sp.]
MRENNGLLSGGLGMVLRNKRYIVWFYALNVVLALFGTMAFVNQAGTILDHSLRADRLLHGFDISVLAEMFLRPEFGPAIVSRMPAVLFALVFMFATTLFLPGVLQGYASTYRLPREDFFRTCGRNLWRFIRLTLAAGIVMIPLTAALFGVQGLLTKKASESTNELLVPGVRLAGLLVIFLAMTAVRIWFDLAQTDIVLSDQRAVRRSIGAAFRHTWRNVGRLLGDYVVITIVAAIVFVAGVWAWMKFVPPANLGGAFLVSQLTLLVLLIPRFWQRGVVVNYYLKNMVEPIAVQPFTPVVAVAPMAEGTVPVPIVPSAPPQGQAS